MHQRAATSSLSAHSLARTRLFSSSPVSSTNTTTAPPTTIKAQATTDHHQAISPATTAAATSASAASSPATEPSTTNATAVPSTSTQDESPAAVPEFGPIPLAARLLGYAGLIPFILGGVGAVVLPDINMANAGLAAFMQMTYASSIASFMGAVHWGLALAEYKRGMHAFLDTVPHCVAACRLNRARDSNPHDLPLNDWNCIVRGGGTDRYLLLSDGARPSKLAQFSRYGLGVLPALGAWGSMALAPEPGMMVLMVIMTGQFVFDAIAHELKLVPSWYMRLRTPLTLIALLSLGTTLMQLKYI